MDTSNSFSFYKATGCDDENFVGTVKKTSEVVHDCSPVNITDVIYPLCGKCNVAAVWARIL